MYSITNKSKLVVLVVVTLLVVLISTTTTSAQKGHHCIDDDFTVNSILLEPSQKFDDEQIIYFSSTTQKQRVDVNELEPEIRTFSVYMRYDQGKMYIYDKQTKDCQVHALHGQLKPFCLASNATHETQVTIGGSLKADVWKENAFGFEIRLILSSFQNIPINIFTKGGTHKGLIMQEWFNYKRGVESDRIFDIPDTCNQQQMAPAIRRSSQTHLRANESTTSIPTKRILERLNKITMGYTQH